MPEDCQNANNHLIQWQRAKKDTERKLAPKQFVRINVGEMFYLFFALSSVFLALIHLLRKQYYLKIHLFFMSECIFDSPVYIGLEW